MVLTIGPEGLNFFHSIRVFPMSSQINEVSMQLSRISKGSDQLGRYYTVQEVAGLLIEIMSVSQPATVIELGVGDGALLREATQQWSSARFFTVDIDGRAKSSLPSNVALGTISHYVGDALEYGLDQKIGVDFGSIDSAICNPPYIRPKWRQHFSDILEGAGLQGIVQQLRSMPAEVLFIAQNLRFLRDGGKLGLILPDGVVSGEKFSGLRKTLGQMHRIERVIELPRRIFRNTDAKAHIVVLSKNLSPAEFIKVQKLDSSGTLSETIELPSKMAGSRLDFSYLKVNRASVDKKEAILLRSITRTLKRGTFSSVERKKSTLKILHTTDIFEGRLSVPREFAVKKSFAESSSFVVAHVGDILIARVGRNLSRKIWRVTIGPVIISDCVLLLRVDPLYVDKVFEHLTSDAGREELISISHGVGASFITMDGLLGMNIKLSAS